MISPDEKPGVAIAAAEARGTRARRADAAEPASPERPEPWKIAVIAAQVALLLLVIKRFEIESRAYHQVTMLAAGGFLVHAFLPLRHRLAFFLLLSIAAIAMVLGPAAGGWVLAIGCGLIVVSRLPIPFRLRAGILLLAGACLALQRAGRLPAPWPSFLWPVLGSLFMFRFLVYLYDLKHEKARPGLLQTLSYFFMLPNVCFPFFPVVDFKTFRRSQGEGDPHEVYQTGVHWMLRGVVHLLLYRIVYTDLTLDPAEVRGPFELSQFLITNFLLYLRVSGQFHMVVGMLHLFGFNLPETNHLYALSSSFTDFWRRINIYWKDFMMKVFYYPFYFALKARGATFALVASTIAVFAITWFLHSYQWFWLRGAFPIAAQDVAFWGLLGGLVVATSLYEARHGRKRTLGSRAISPGERLGAALKTIGTLTAICVLWSLWTADSLASWASLWALGLGAAPGGGSAAAAPWLFAGLVAIGLGGALAAGGRANAPRGPAAFPRRAAATACVILALFAISLRTVNVRLGPMVAGLVQSLRNPELSRRDAALMERGYYENLLDVNRMNTQLWEVFMKRPRIPLLHETPVGRLTGDIYKTVLVPSVTMPYHGGTLSTNRWGMRDRDYAETKPSGTYRVALLGSSHVMGSGVTDEATFEGLLETRLNDAAASSGDSARYEILNFAVAGFSPLQQIAMLDDKVWRFEPNAVFYVAHANDRVDILRRLGEMIREGTDLRYDVLRDVARRADVDRKTKPAVGMARLAPFGDELLAWVYGRVTEECRRHGARAVWVFLPRVQEEREEERALLAGAAERAGFRLFDLSDTYDGSDLESLYLAEWDRHPNVAGHRLVADRLLRALREAPDIVPLPPALVAADSDEGRTSSLHEE